MSKEKLYIFDTTLRDGAQTEGVDFSVEDKNKIAKVLSEIGVDYIEGGWPGANPVDTEFFSKPFNHLIVSGSLDNNLSTLFFIYVFCSVLLAKIIFFPPIGKTNCLSLNFLSFGIIIFLYLITSLLLYRSQIPLA